MANEATVRSQLEIKTGNIDYHNRPGSFRADVAGKKGPLPGLVDCTTSGTDIAFTGLTTPAYCLLKNIDETNFVEIGVWDGATFHELLELKPGEEYVVRLSRNMTGLRGKANTATVSLIVDAFED